MKPNSTDLRAAIIAFLDGQLPQKQVIDLSARLRSDPHARQLFLQLADEHSCLAVDESLWLPAPRAARPTEQNRREVGWFAKIWRQSWAPLGVGIAAGGVCTSVVWGRVTATPAPTPVPLHDSSFESGTSPEPLGVPARCICGAATFRRS